MPGRKKKDAKSKFWQDQVKKGATQLRIGSIWEEPSPTDSETADGTASSDVADRETQIAEQKKYGINFNDDYNYLQHFKSVSELYDSEMVEVSRAQKLEVDDAMSESGASEQQQRLPSSKMETRVKGYVGTLILADTQSGLEPELDPDIMAALDSDGEYDPENELEDDFISKAHLQASGSCLGDADKLAHHFQKMVHFQGEDVTGGDEEKSDVDSQSVDASDEDWTDEEDAEWTDGEEGEKGVQKRIAGKMRSATSRPLKNNGQVLDEHIEVLKQKEYGEDQIGALDCEELSGRVTLNSDLCQQALEQFENEQEVITMKDIVDSPDRIRPYIPESWKYIEEKGCDDETLKERDEKMRRPVWSPQKPQWDCVSILSTLSRTKNIPTTMDWPSPETEKTKMKKKPQADEGRPEGDSDSIRGLTLKELEKQMKTERLADAPATYRPSGESAEEKRERKQAVKEHQRERRAEKKANRLAFKSEMDRQNNLVKVRSMQERVVSFQDNK